MHPTNRPDLSGAFLIGFIPSRIAARRQARAFFEDAAKVAEIRKTALFDNSSDGLIGFHKHFFGFGKAAGKQKFHDRHAGDFFEIVR